MTKKLSVMLVDEDQEQSAMLACALRDSGYDVLARIGVKENLSDRVRVIQPDMIIMDIQTPDRGVLESIRRLSDEQPRPVVIFAKQTQPATITEAVKAGVCAYVVDGFNANRIQAILDVALARFQESQELKRELARAKTELANRKIIDKAKGIIMQQRKCSEDEAYKALRKLAMDRNEKLVDVAKNLIEFKKLFV